MKKLLSMVLAILLYSCTNEVALNVNPEEKSTPDYNLLSEGPTYLYYDLPSNKYSGQALLYLRPFENVSDFDNVTLLFSSNQFASYIVKNDTLYNGDKINVKYADFKKYILDFTYLSEAPGTHTVTVETTIRTVRKTTSINLLSK